MVQTAPRSLGEKSDDLEDAGSNLESCDFWSALSLARIDVFTLLRQVKYHLN